MDTAYSEIDSAWGVGHFNPWDSRITYENIWPIYERMRQQGGVTYSDAVGGFWSLSKFQDVRDAARDNEVFSSAKGTSIGNRDGDSPSPPNAPIDFDPPDQTRYRKAMQEPFLPNKIGALSDFIRSVVRDLLDRIEAMGEFDIVADLAEPVPQEVLSRVLNFDMETRVKNRQLVLNVIHANLETSKAAWAEFRAFLLGEIRRRVSNPGDDFLSHLCVDEFDGQRFSESELVAILVSLALAGHHTSINAISSMLRHVSNPEVKQDYFSDPSINTKIVEETLRFDSPVHLEGRTTTREVEIGGVKIPAGASVALIYASANRDEDKFPNAANFDWRRESNQHLAFGYGIHTCLGVHVARLEMRIVLEEMLQRFPSYRLTGSPVGSGMVFGHHMGWESMPAAIT